MGDPLDDLLGRLASVAGAAAPQGVEAEVWSQIDQHQAAASRLRSGVMQQFAIGACALVVGFSYQVYAHAPWATSGEPPPSARLLDGSPVAETGAFQVLR